MKKQITFTLMLLISIVTYSQIKYEKGYFISNDGTKTECLIKNEDWRHNPKEFNYKLSGNDDILTGNIYKVQEFGVLGESKYIRTDVQIDISPSITNELDNIRSPKWSSQTVFLKILVHGDATLFQYSKSNNLKFFYNTSQNQKVNQLIFKEYLTSKGDVTKNLTYINQLFKEVNCEKKEINQIRKVEYKQNSLIKYFNENNFCINPNIEKNKIFNKNKGTFNFKFTPGVNFSSLSISNDKILQNDYDINYESNVAFRIGLEIEYVLPFNKNKWSVFIEPNYSYYKSEIEKEIHSGFINSTRTLQSNVEINSIEIPLGIRHYLFLKNDSKIFLNAAINWNLDMDSNIEFDLRNDLDDIGSNVFFFGGLGYNLNGKYSIEMRYYSKNVLSNYLYWESDYKTFSLIFGYNFL